MKHLLTYLFLLAICCVGFSQVDTSNAPLADTTQAPVPDPEISDTLTKSLNDFDELRFEDDSITMLPDSLQTHSVKKAVIMSMALPGLGQVYNGKWWKVPIVAAAIVVPLNFAIENNKEYRLYLDEFLTSDLDPNDPNDRRIGQELITVQDYYRRRRDLWILVTALGYGLNILDSYVDAHLYYYDISENISLNWEPTIWRNPAGFNNVGISLKLNFK